MEKLLGTKIESAKLPSQKNMVFKVTITTYKSMKYIALILSAINISSLRNVHAAQIDAIIYGRKV